MIFLIFDTALNEQYTLIQLQQKYPMHTSLFQGTKDEALFDIAPYVFEIDAQLFEKVNGPLIKLHEMVYIETDENMKDTIDHFQLFIYKLINNKEYFFRFWDARVLPKYLHECNEDQLNTFFGNVKAFYIEDKNGTSFQKFEKGRKNKLLNIEVQKKIVFDTIEIPKTSEVVSETDQPKKRRFFVE